MTRLMVREIAIALASARWMRRPIQRPFNPSATIIPAMKTMPSATAKIQPDIFEAAGLNRVIAEQCLPERLLHFLDLHGFIASTAERLDGEFHQLGIIRGFQREGVADFVDEPRSGKRYFMVSGILFGGVARKLDVDGVAGLKRVLGVIG